MNWINSALAVAEQSMLVTSKRAEVLATNLANANTPGYKARDIDFKAIMSEQQLDAGLKGTRPGHFETGFTETLASRERSLGEGDVQNGNTVSKEKEQAAYTENSIRYLASLRFLDGNVKGLLKALRGE